MPNGPITSVSLGPADPYTQVQDYAGGTNVVYIGLARSTQRTNTTLAVTSLSAAAAAVITSVAHGLNSDNVVTISGATGDWAALNGAHIITVTGVDTFTIAVNTSAYSGTFAGSVTTYAPRTSAAIWAIQKLYYSGDNVIRMAWAAWTSAENQIWDNRASLSFQ